jgi:hypothetical protein
MRGEGQLLRFGEYLLGRAGQGLPKNIRAERYREWTAELPAILHDPQVRFAPFRALRMLAYAADIFGTTNFTPARDRRQVRGATVVLSLFLIAGVANLSWLVWAMMRTPDHGPNYATLAWALAILAYPITGFLRGSLAASTIFLTSMSGLFGAVVCLWNVVLAPGDWVNYGAAVLLLLLGTSGLFIWRVGDRWSRVNRA